jgi:hypothetical protein
MEKVSFLYPLIMKGFTKVLRTIGLVVLIILAIAGIAIVPIFPREEPMRKRNTTELVEKRDEEDEIP